MNGLRMKPVTNFKFMIQNEYAVHVAIIADAYWLMLMLLPLPELPMQIPKPSLSLSPQVWPPGAG